MFIKNRQAKLLIKKNPRRTKLVLDISKLNQYTYCGHGALMDKKMRDWQDTDHVLSFFGTKKTASPKRYLAHVKAVEKKVATLYQIKAAQIYLRMSLSI